jgi:hypothetical protein
LTGGGKAALSADEQLVTQAQEREGEEIARGGGASVRDLSAGQMSVTTSDGQSRQFVAGDVLRVEDAAPCKGHISVVGASPAYAAIVR